MRFVRPILLILVAASIAAPAIVKERWPVYGPWLARLAARLAQDIVPSQHILVAGTTVFTPRTEVLISAECSGAQSIRTFGIIGIVVLLLNWRYAANWRFLILYVGSEAILWLYNWARLAFEILHGQQQYGVSEIMVVLVSGMLALAAIRMARSRRGLSGAAGLARVVERG